MKKDWETEEVGGDAIWPNEGDQEQLTKSEEDRVDAYVARLHEVTCSLASKEEVENLLLAAKIEVSRRQAIAAHRAASVAPLRQDAPHMRENTTWKKVAKKTFSAVGDILSLWTLFALATFIASTHVNYADGAAKALFAITVASTLGTGAAQIHGWLRRRNSETERLLPPGVEPWWRERMQLMADGLHSRKPAPVMRMFDILFALFAMLSMALPLAIGYALTRIKGRAVFDRQPRVGQGGRVFTRYKFNVQTDDNGAPATNSDLVLIRSGIEQLPRLWNLLVGDLTLVGPKPENPALAVQYPRSCRWVFEYRPGLTGPVSAEFRTWLTVEKFDAATYLTRVVPIQSWFDRNYFNMSSGRQLRFACRALGMLTLPLLLENFILSRDSAEDGRKKVQKALASAPDAPKTTEEVEVREEQLDHMKQVTKWSRHEYDQALA
ncbi:sugar transferase [Streptomyces mirabilis]|uniref:sugar transferase n=1 Tax=Streptomyces mirabilis TaxID=68239 RepID=UPI00364CBF1F